MYPELQPDEELLLRPWTFRDAPAMLVLIRENQAHLSAWLPWVEDRSTSKGVDNYIQSTRFSSHGNGNCFYGIWENGILVGEIARTANSPRNRFCAMSYWLAASAQGRGIALRSSKSLLAHNFRDLDMNRVEIRVAVGNARSRAVVEKLGFKREGLLRKVEWVEGQFMDHEVFSMLRQEWKEMYAGG